MNKESFNNRRKTDQLEPKSSVRTTRTRGPWLGLSTSKVEGLTNDLTGSAVVLFPPVTGSDDRLRGPLISFLPICSRPFVSTPKSTDGAKNTGDRQHCTSISEAAVCKRHSFLVSKVM